MHPPELLVYDDLDVCPYLEGRTARLPMRVPLRPLSRSELDARLAAGDRRQGSMLYTTACPDCAACEPIRLEVARFAPNRSQRRAYRRGEQALEVELGPPKVDQQRLRLYQRHKMGRDLSVGEGPIDADGYRSFLVDSCCETFEMRYRLEGQLIGVALADRGERSLSAVYCYFDPNYERLSPGTYSVLKQIELCREWGLKYLYLGFYIADSSKMRYKGNFRPHERLIDGRWQLCE